MNKYDKYINAVYQACNKKVDYNEIKESFKGLSRDLHPRFKITYNANEFEKFICSRRITIVGDTCIDKFNVYVVLYGSSLEEGLIEKCYIDKNNVKKLKSKFKFKPQKSFDKNQMYIVVKSNVLKSNYEDRHCSFEIMTYIPKSLCYSN